MPIAPQFTQYQEQYIVFSIQKQPPDVFCKKDALADFAKFTEHLCQSLFFNKVAGLRPAILTKSARLSISPYSVRMRENVDQNNSEYGHFLRSGVLLKSNFTNHSFTAQKMLLCSYFLDFDHCQLCRPPVLSKLPSINPFVPNAPLFLPPEQMGLISQIFHSAVLEYGLKKLYSKGLRCVKSVRIRGYSGPHFPAFGLNTSPYSVRMRGNVDQNNSKYEHFSQRAYFQGNNKIMKCIN